MPDLKAPASAGEPVYLAVGLMRRPHGLRGDILFDVYTDFPERLKPGSLVYLGDDKQPIKITRRRPRSAGLILGFEGVANPEQAARYTGKTAFVRADDRPPLPEGEYYHHQLIGLDVVDDGGRVLGKLAEILETGANDVYVVKDESGREILLPEIDDVILSIRLETQTITVHLLPGLVNDVEDE